MPPAPQDLFLLLFVVAFISNFSICAAKVSTVVTFISVHFRNFFGLIL